MLCHILFFAVIKIQATYRIAYFAHQTAKANHDGMVDPNALGRILQLHIQPRRQLNSLTHLPGNSLILVCPCNLAGKSRSPFSDVFIHIHKIAHVTWYGAFVMILQVYARPPGMIPII